MAMLSATTLSGDEVNLFENGTWEFASSANNSSEVGFNVADQDFRKIGWGNNMAAVLASQPSEPDFSDDETIAYDGSLAGNSCTICYDFINGKLYSGRYVFADIYSENSRYIEFFESLKDQLSKKYGNPKISNYVWANELYQDDINEWGTAVSADHLTLIASWQSESSDIDLVCRGVDYEIKIIIQYQSKNLRGEAESKFEQELQDQI
jgi:hypothetical protein